MATSWRALLGSSPPKGGLHGHVLLVLVRGPEYLYCTVLYCKLLYSTVMAGMRYESTVQYHLENLRVLFFNMLHTWCVKITIDKCYRNLLRTRSASIVFETKYSLRCGRDTCVARLRCHPTGVAHITYERTRGYSTVGPVLYTLQWWSSVSCSVRQ